MTRRIAARRASAPALLALLAAGAAAFAPGAARAEPVRYAAPSGTSSPAVWVDVREPAKVRAALAANGWLRAVRAKPLGKGFLGGWAGFLGSRGEDLAATFRGALEDAVLVPMLAQPFRVEWLSGESADLASPVFVVPAPGAAARAAFGALDAAARKGELVSSCVAGGPDLRFSRWQAAEQALYGALLADRLAFSRHPAPLLRALCAPATVLPAQGADVELGVAPGNLGRSAQLGAALAGLGGAARLQLSVERDRLVPAGLAADLIHPVRLAIGKTPDGLLRLVPASTPVVLTAQLNLPTALEAAPLRTFWAEVASLPLLQRQATFLWWPSGGGKKAQSVALVWSRPEDRAALEKLLAGANKLSAGVLCGHLAFASSPDLLAGLADACEGRKPSLRDAAPGLVQGLGQPASVTLLVQLGEALAQLASDGADGDEQGGSGGEALEEALQQLRALSSLGFSGVLQQSALAPKGFGP